MWYDWNMGRHDDKCQFPVLLRLTQHKYKSLELPIQSANLQFV